MDDDAEPTSQEVDRMAEFLERQRAALAWRAAQPYDGLLGSLPDWAPEWHQNQFHRIRNKLLETQANGKLVEPAIILEWIAAYAAMGEAGEGPYRPNYFRAQFKDEIGRLAHYRYVVGLGEHKGLLALAGEDAVAGRAVRAGGRKGRDAARASEGKQQARAEMQKVLNRARADHPKANLTRLRELVAKQLRVSTKTVARHTK